MRFVAVGSLLLLTLLTAGGPLTAQVSLESALLGRWDLTVETPAGPRPSWLEVRHSGYRTLVGQFVGPVGSARPIAQIDVSDDVARFHIPPQWEEHPGGVTVAARRSEEGLVGTIDFGNGVALPWKGVRAPTLRRAGEPAWGDPVPLFDGRSLDGWRVFGGENRWSAQDGVLRGDGGGGNLATERTFDDFQLHVEFRYPRGSNSGVYLRGRYEVQITDSIGGEPTSELLGGIYGFITPNALVARNPGEWQSYDITLVGRQITVVANGQTIIWQQEIPGITGGALDSDEGRPGPIYLQGDHGPVEYRNITITPARARSGEEGGYRLVWSDEFDGSGLPDASRWSYDEGDGCPDVCGWGNEEAQFYTVRRAENARVEDGVLIIEARREPVQGKDFTSARLVSRGKGDWTYGRVEARARLPSGRGTWPAVWMLPTAWVYGSWPASGEIDIMEHVGFAPDSVHFSVHTAAYNHLRGTQSTRVVALPDAERAYHVYAIEWTPERIQFYLDGTPQHAFANSGRGPEEWPFDQAFHLVLNLAVGGTWGGAQGIDAAIWPQRMEVDWVRVYQRAQSH